MAQFDARVPAQLRRLARQLARSLDVSGVYWSTRRRRGVWTDEPCLSVEVYRKHPGRRLTQDRLLPTELEGHPVDVIEVGAVLGASLSHAVAVSAPGHEASTITAVRTTGAGERLALLSGHGTLPVVGNLLQQSYDRSAGAVATVRAAHDTGHLRLGRLSSTLDFAVAEFPSAQPEPRHALGGAVARRAPLARGERVHHFSIRDHQSHRGILDLGLTGHPVTFGGVVITFARLIRVRAPDGQPPFGVFGDSGSLVVDDANEAIGVIVGIDVHSTFTYVLPLYGLHQKHPAIFCTFFQ